MLNDVCAIQLKNYLLGFRCANPMHYVYANALLVKK